MAVSYATGYSYKSAISADFSNQIGQKLFAYIYNGNELTTTVKEKFKKSLIFLGYEGQIYNPLTNTYVGVGTTAYTNLKKYTEDIDERLTALNQALTSSLVSSVYANHGKEDLALITHMGGLEADVFKSYTGDIFATNDIILKGIGDYDVENRVRTTKEFINVKNGNISDDINEAFLNSYLVNSDKTNPFATSGITVKLEKGRYKYRWSLKETYRPKDDYTDLGGGTFNVPYETFITQPEDAGINPITPQLELSDTEFIATIAQLIAEFGGTKTPYKGENGLPDLRDAELTDALFVKDGEIKIGVTEAARAILEKYYEPVKDSSGACLYKNGKNVFTIDDSQTWAYISHAYSYTLDFAQQFTTSEVNRIYSEILGLGNEESIIPVSYSLIRKIVDDNSTFEYNVTDHVFEVKADDSDEGLLHKTILNKDSVFFRKIYFDSTKYAYTFTEDLGEDTNNKDVNTYTHIQGLTTYISNILTLAKGQTVTSFDIFEQPDNKIEQIKYSVTPDSDTFGESFDVVNLRSWDDIKDVAWSDNTLLGAEFIYQGSEVSTGTVSTTDTRYGLDYFLIPVTDLSQVDASSHYVVVNKFAASNNVTNLQDGINTLKEAAYVLDWITNGSLDPQNPEASGIEMAYSIAQNHIDIQKLHERLQQVEGGKNVVNNINVFDAGTHEFAKVNLESNLYKNVDNNLATGITWTAVTVEPSTPIVWDKDHVFVYKKGESNGKIDYEVILDSEILEYNRLVAAYILDKDNHTPDGKTTTPVLHSNGAVIPADSVFKALSSDIDTQGALAYVGDVKIGVDLITATTYTNHDHTHTGDGYVAIPFEDVKKNIEISISIPVKTDVRTNDITGINNNRYEIGNVTTLTSATVNQISNLISGYGITLNDEALTVTDNSNVTVAGKYTVTGNSIVGLTIKVATDNNAINNPKVTSVKYTVVDQDTQSNVFGTALYAFDGSAYTAVVTDGELSASTQYYVRYNEVGSEATHPFAYVGDNALATTEWVQAYTYHMNESVGNDILAAKLDAYNYAKTIVNSIDSIASVLPGQVITGVELSNGQLSVSYANAPKDKVIVNNKVWGESNDSSLNKYTTLSGDDKADRRLKIYNELNEHTLYIKDSVRYQAIEMINGHGDDAIIPEGVYYVNNDGVMTPIETTDIIAVNSYKYGIKYAAFKQLYTQHDAFKVIDNADITFVFEDADRTENIAVTEMTYGGAEIFEKIDTDTVTKRVEYLTATVEHNSVTYGGNGENTFHISANVTKLVDADDANTGFADANDVKQTLNNLFEWVDLSQYIGIGEPDHNANQGF